MAERSGTARRRPVWILVIGALLASVLLPLAVDAGAAPTDCSITISGATTVVTWTADPAADQYVVSRSIDGGPTWWRGRTSDTSFTDTTRVGAAYVVQSRSADGERGPFVPCSETPTSDPLACAAAVGAERAAEPLLATDVRGTPSGTPREAAAPGPGSHRSPTSPLGDPITCAHDDERQDRIDVVAFGDMVTCGVPGPERVADLVDTLPGAILGLGDFSQQEGTIEQFRDCFDPVMGRHVDRIEPVPGNHEYRTPGAAGYFEYFGEAAGDPDKGYYARTKGNWQILYLNSVCWRVGGCEMGAPQQQWLRDTLAAAPDGLCRIAIMHHPRWSSWGPYASQAGLDPIYSLLHDAGTDLILTGHAHHYERLIRLDPDGNADPTSGFRQITVGTGGTAPRFPEPDDVVTDISATLVTGEWGVLDLDLYGNSYDWRFVTVDGAVLDAGSDTCLS